MASSPTASTERTDYKRRYVRKRGKLRRNIRRDTNDGETISTTCDGTTLVERYLDENGQLAERRTENSPACPL